MNGSTRPRKRPRQDLSHRPHVLHAASIERMDEADLLWRSGRWALCMYAAGLAVESLLQAFALRTNEPHDAHHNLPAWLNKCPAPVVDSIRSRASAEWALISVYWRNDLRYLSESGLLGRLRDRRLHKGIVGDRHSILRVSALRCVSAARVVHNKGLVQWQHLYSNA